MSPFPPRARASYRTSVTVVKLECSKPHGGGYTLSGCLDNFGRNHVRWSPVRMLRQFGCHVGLAFCIWANSWIHWEGAGRLSVFADRHATRLIGQGETFHSEQRQQTSVPAGFRRVARQGLLNGGTSIPNKTHALSGMSACLIAELQWHFTLYAVYTLRPPGCTVVFAESECSVFG